MRSLWNALIVLCILQQLREARRQQLPIAAPMDAVFGLGNDYDSGSLAISGPSSIFTHLLLLFIVLFCFVSFLSCLFFFWVRLEREISET